MSVASIGDRVAQLQQHVAAMTGAPAAADAAASTTFSQALQTAQGATATPASLAAGAPTQYDAQITAAATKYGLDPALLKGLIRQESNFDASAQSPAGAQGLTQLMPGTAASLGVDAADPAQAIDGGARYLKAQLDRFGNDPSKALAAYNAGPGAVARFGGVPPYAETQAYVQKVLGYAAGYGSAAPTTLAATSAVPAATVPVSAASLAGVASPSLDYSTL
ncbi:MAG TPA: lytic transglycosylase domain-containing protein [Baekduia sp.]|uniref:lytic transglycosylase domain-containing protein n=1 Tax=Baekduia sp. TaxID=2600305 RepID=UPI002B893646|nr:lytic transglycosylase domain-containing protein [Baekduia sp.]HMJ37898.1 lytic transglycosylase domain-containing protein [Baekduia sp.]